MHRTFALLLVEDDRTLGFITAEALRLRGHTVTVAATAEAVKRQLRQRSAFDAILLDLDLGTERGEVLVARLRSEGVDVPEVVILSAQPIEVLVRAQRKLDACGLVQKPASVDDIARELERCIPHT